MSEIQDQTDDLYSIYRFRDPRDQAVIYVGVTNNPDRRYRQHVGKRGLLYPLIQELAAKGLMIIFEIIETIDGFDNASQREREHIQQNKPLLNSIHNSTVIRQRKAEEKYAEEITLKMDLYGFTYEQAVIWYQEFSASDGDWYGYQTIAKTVIATNKHFNIKTEISHSEILEIALEVSGYYRRGKSLVQSEGVDGE